MSHLDVDVIDFLILALIPAVALFIIEMIFRAIKAPSWPKLTIQGMVMLGFAIAYVTVITPHVLTAIGLLALAIVLFYQARRSKINPKKSLY